MGGKGIRRREKNYRAAHGSYSRLPPPPDPSKHNAVPSKLRQIMSFSSFIERQNQNQGSDEVSKDIQTKRKKKEDYRDAGKKKDRSEAGAASDATQLVNNGQTLAHEPAESGDEFMNHNSNEKKKKKKKRKRNQVQDLRFEMEIGQTKSKLKRKERKKKYLESKKKKHKAVTDEEVDFPGREKVEFGDVVQAPPKLPSIPMALKQKQNASHERIRLQAVDAYRNRKGWSSRPGLHLPPAITTEAAP